MGILQPPRSQPCMSAQDKLQLGLQVGFGAELDISETMQENLPETIGHCSVHERDKLARLLMSSSTPQLLKSARTKCFEIEIPPSMILRPEIQKEGNAEPT